MSTTEALKEIDDAFGQADGLGQRCWTHQGALCEMTISAAGTDGLFVSTISLAPSLRNAGYGTQIFATLQSIAERNHCRIGLTAFQRPDMEDGGPLFRFYTRLGFQPIGGDDQGYVEFEWEPDTMAPCPGL